jgi:capsule polysaccharide modification protein KpsS
METQEDMMMRIQENGSFGPPWVILNRHGVEVATAHLRADAEAFLKADISWKELMRRNEIAEKLDSSWAEGAA